MKNILLSGIIFSLLITFSLFFCADPIKPPFIELSLNLPEEQACLVNELLEIKVEANPPQLVDVITLIYDGKIKEKTMPSNPETGVIVFSDVQFSKTGKFEIKASIKVKNSGMRTKIDTITIGDIPVFKNNKKIGVSSQDPKIGENFTMTADANGYGLLTYFWYKGETVLDGNYNSYNFPSLKKEDEGEYKCIVNSIWGEDITDAFILVVSEINIPPEISVEPTDVSITAGHDAIFTIVATGNGLIYQWYKNNEPIPNSQSSIHKVIKAKLEDNGTKFKCIVKNSVGEDTSKVAVLNVTVDEIAPEITTQPKSTEVFAGGDAIFSVVASGTNLQYDWFKNGVIVNDVTSNIFTIKNVAIDNNGAKIKCMISNSKDTVESNEVELIVKNVEKPEIIDDPIDVKAQENDTVSFMVKADGKNLTYQWERDKKEIPGATKTIYTITKCTLKDNGAKFRCVVKNAGGITTSSEATLTVTEEVVEPKITVHPQDKKVKEGKDAIFTVTATGLELIYQWKRDDVNIIDATKESYSLPSVNKTDNGARFKCVVTNSAGSITSNEALLTVIEKVIPPKIIEGPKDITIKKDEETTFIVKAEGTNLMYQWYKNEKKIPSATQNVYKIPPAKEEDNKSEFKCIVNNSEGEAISEIAVLTVHWAPVIDKHPKDQEVEKNQKVTFKISMKNMGNPKCTFEWSNGETNDSISFNASENDNGKEFYCKVSNKVEFLKSESAILSVIWKPEIDLDNGPDDQVIQAGNTASFSINMINEGNPKCTYRWFADNKAIPNSNSTKFSKKTIKNKSVVTYNCKAKNRLGEVLSSDAILSVWWIDSLIIKGPVKAIIGETKEYFVSSIDANPLNSVTYSWNNGGGSSTTKTVKFTSVGPVNVECTAKLNGASVNANINVNVEPKPNTAPKITETNTGTKSCANDAATHLILHQDIKAYDKENHRIEIRGKPKNDEFCAVRHDMNGSKLIVQETNCNNYGFYVIIWVVDEKGKESESVEYEIKFSGDK